MPDYKILPADQEILKTITANSTWNDLTVSFRNKILPAGNLNKPIGEKCYKLLKTLIKKDKVSASTLSKGCPLLTKTIMKNQNTSIAKMEMKSDNSSARRRGSGGGGWNKGAGKAGKTGGGKYGGGSKDDYYEKLVSEIVKKQLDAEKLILSGQVETVNKVLVDTTQPKTNFPAKPKNLPPYTPSIYTKEQQEEMEKAHDDFIDSKYNKYKEEGGTISRHEFLIEEADREAQQNQVPNAYQHYMEDNYEEFVIPQYSVELDPILNDPRNN